MKSSTGWHAAHFFPYGSANSSSMRCPVTDVIFMLTDCPIMEQLSNSNTGLYWRRGGAGGSTKGAGEGRKARGGEACGIWTQDIYLTRWMDQPARRGERMSGGRKLEDRVVSAKRARTEDKNVRTYVREWRARFQSKMGGKKSSGWHERSTHK